MNSLSAPRYAVIGAGMAGLACADALAGGGARVCVVDKGRRLGGRLATRARDGRSFDHGAQFASAEGPAFADALARFEAAGTAAVWPALGGGPGPRYVGVPGMADLAAPLADGLDVRLSTEVAAIDGAAGAWTLRLKDGAPLGPFDAVLVTAPAPQAAALLAPVAPDLAAQAARAVYAPCAAAMIAAPGPADAPAFLHPEAGPIGWACRSETRPGRPHPAGVQQWLIHATPDWSADHLDDDKADLVAPLQAALEALLGAPLGPPVYSAGHKWRYSLVTEALGRPCLFEPERGLGAGGDWCLDARVEAAFESGRALAAAVAVWGTLRG
ncbi:NAD(P)/FAD-dependent oxidoreductase [Rhodothalassium salexigens]|uniref:NAD(P)/FAD-dependent oxidoreductase n=1 Tax=Rhodothalassium salexigens TaxID=1086 RepID=UPI001911FA92|nr:FAD-dependent oxidoreductase [Rhodothalassium salexigens]